jgi:hypothetical protein
MLPHASSHEFEHLEGGRIVLAEDIETGKYRVEVTQSHPFDPDRGELGIELRFLGEETAEIVRIQITNEDGSTSAKATAHAHGETLGAHIGELPDNVTAHSGLIIEIEDADGNVETRTTHIHVH